MRTLPRLDTLEYSPLTYGLVRVFAVELEHLIMIQSMRFTVFLMILSAFVVLSFDTASAQLIEPLLQKYCLGCHNETDREAGLSLQTPESLKKGSENGAVVDPADAMKSLLYAVLAKDSDQAMPPEGEPQPTAAEREQLRQWVLAGAQIKPMAAGAPNVPTVKPFHTVAKSLLASAVSADGKTVSVGGDRFVSLRPADSGEVIWKADVVNGKVTGLTYASTQPWLVVATGMPGVGGRSLLLSTKDGTTVKEFGGHTDIIYAAVLNHDDSVLATAGYDRRIVLHDVNSGDILRTLEGHNGSVFSLSFSPAGDILCSASADGTVKVWNVLTGERLDTLSQPQAEQYTVLVSGDGQQIFAAGADNRIRVWKLISKDTPRINPQLVSRFAHEQPITRMSLSADGTLLASCAEDGTLRVWSAWPLQALQTLPQQQVAVTSLSFVGTSGLLITRLDGTSEVLKLQAATSPKDVPQNVPQVAVQNILPEQLQQVTEAEGNDAADAAQQVPLPVVISGVIKPNEGNDQDADCFRFSAKAGQQLLLEVKAQRDKSPLDSRIAILMTDGQPVLQTRLQAVRDSYFTFRGKDSDTSDDFRVFNWQEMELNEFLYSDGEVVRLWLYPRGPDSGYKVYPGFGNRHTYFGTTPTSHALQAPCFIVVPRTPEEELTSNGLPTFPIYYENDDDGQRELGSDSRLYFTAPADGDYVVRVTDARGFSGEDYKYQLTVRAPQPSFEVSVSTRKVTVNPGTGREIEFTAKRIDGYEGPITIDAAALPEGFGFSGPIEIQERQFKAFGTLFATEGAEQPTEDQRKAIKFTASSKANGVRDLGGLEELTLAAAPKLRVRILPNVEKTAEPPEPVVLQLRAGQTIQAALRLERLMHDGVVSLGKEDAGRNLPHGVFVDNIGLNGLLLLQGQSDRDFFVTAAKWVPASTSTFYLKSNVDGVTSLPVTLKIVAADSVSDKQEATASVSQ